MPHHIRRLALAATVLVALVAACAPVKAPPAPPGPPAPTLPAPPSDPAPFTVGGEGVVHDDWQLTQLGLESWPDGEMGVERSGTGYTFHAPRGGGVQTRTGDSLDSPAGASAAQFQIQGVPPEYDYAAGGSVYTHPGTGIKLLLTHLEQWRDGLGTNFYATVGLAKSTDGGASWTFLGEIVRHAVAPDQCMNHVADAGSGTHAIRNEGGTEYLYVYVHDQQDCSRVNSLAVARAPVGEIVSAAAAGTVSNWAKYHDNGWGQPGIGGVSTDLWPDPTPWTNFGSVSWNTHLGRYVLVIARPHTTLLLRTFRLELLQSNDGLGWSAPQVMAESLTELIYPTAVGLEADPHQTGQSFHVYYVSSLLGPSGRWFLASLNRRTITFG
jgi:hypothetical protein